MINMERYILELKKKHYPVWWKCSECPAQKYCDNIDVDSIKDTNINHCLYIFEEWANKEAE